MENVQGYSGTTLQLKYGDFTRNPSSCSVCCIWPLRCRYRDGALQAGARTHMARQRVRHWALSLYADNLASLPQRVLESGIPSSIQRPGGRSRMAGAPPQSDTAHGGG